MRGSIEFELSGVSADATAELHRRLEPGRLAGESRSLAEELIAFVDEQWWQAAGAGRHLPGSTEVLESCFGKYKALEKGKWVKVDGWAGIDAAHKEISEGVANYKK